MYKVQHVFYALGRLRAGYPDFFGLWLPLKAKIFGFNVALLGLLGFCNMAGGSKCQ